MSCTVAFQKGYQNQPLSGPAVVEQNDEASNLIRWEIYRRGMGFARE